MRKRSIVLAIAGCALALTVQQVSAQQRGAQQPAAKQPTARQPAAQQPAAKAPAAELAFHPEAYPVGPKVSLACSYNASDVQRTYWVTNNHSAPIPKGRWIYAESTLSGTYPNDKRPAKRQLENDLLPGQNLDIGAVGQTNAGQCTAHFFAGLPDLQVSSVSLYQGNQIKLLVRNNNAFADAGASTTKVNMMKCSQIQLGTTTVATPAVQKGSTKTVYKTITVPSGFDYFDAVADITNAVKESNENNNAFTGVGVCIY